MPILKRPAAAKAQGASKAKAPRRDELAKQIASAAAGLREGDTPPLVVQMVESMLEPALRTYQEERHRYQADVCQMAEHLLQGTEAQLSKDFEAATAEISSLGAEETGKKVAVEEAAKLVEAKEQVLAEKKSSLAQAAMSFRALQQGAQGQREAEAARSAALKGVEDKKAKLVALETTYLQPLIEGVGSDKEAKVMTDKLVKDLTASGSTFDSSMLSALPQAGAKVPSQRGAFDAMVLSQLQEAIKQRVAECDAMLRDGEHAKAAAATALDAAEREFASAREAQLQAAEVFKAASAAKEAADEALGSARQSLREIRPEAQRRAQRRARAEKRLESFRCGPLSAFLALRDRTAPPPAEPTEPADADPEVAAVAEPAEPAVAELASASQVAEADLVA